MYQTASLYADLAGYYDQFCADVDYREQCDFARRAFGCFATSGGNDYFDLACGTGQHLLAMTEHGFTASGLDNSAEMLARAALRVPQAQLLLCDLAAFTQQGAFDLMTCFLYSIHYSYPTEALRQTLRRAWRALKPGGVFIFNAVDAGGIRNDKAVITQLVEGDSQLRFQSGWHYKGRGETLDLALSITRQQGNDIRCWRDQHTMTAITLPQLQAMLAEEGFVVTLLEHDYQRMTVWQEGSYNAIVVACKEGAGEGPLII